MGKKRKENWKDFFLQAYKLWLKENNNNDKRLPGLSKYSDEQLFFINTAQVCCLMFFTRRQIKL
jgi:hypothetical protein